MSTFLIRVPAHSYSTAHLSTGMYASPPLYTLICLCLVLYDLICISHLDIPTHTCTPLYTLFVYHNIRPFFGSSFSLPSRVAFPSRASRGVATRATVRELLRHILMASSSHEPQPTGVMIEDVARLTRLLGIYLVEMPGSEGRRPQRGLSPEEQLSSQAVMAPLPVEIPWPLGIAARCSALPSPRDSMSLGVASSWSSGSRGVSLRWWDGRCQVSDPGSLGGDTGVSHPDRPATRMPVERAFGMTTSELPSWFTAALPSPLLPSPLCSHPSRHIPSRRPLPSPPGGAGLGRSMSGWPPGVAADSGMSIGDIAAAWSGRLDAAPHRLDHHVRRFHADAAGTPANDVSNSRWGDEGAVAPQRPAPSFSGSRG